MRDLKVLASVLITWLLFFCADSVLYSFGSGLTEPLIVQFTSYEECVAGSLSGCERALEAEHMLEDGLYIVAIVFVCWPLSWALSKGFMKGVPGSARQVGLAALFGSVVPLVAFLGGGQGIIAALLYWFMGVAPTWLLLNKSVTRGHNKAKQAGTP